jgi:hypothetical protein
VNGLLDARADLATERFDAELAVAVAAGDLSAETARRLRFWQRASVNAADDHARTVLPAVLDVLDTARVHARRYVDGAADTLEAAAPPPGEQQPDDVPGPAPTERPRPAPGRAPTAAEHVDEPAGALPPVGTVLADLRRASSADDARPSTLEEPSSRLFVADLRDVPARTEQP